MRTERFTCDQCGIEKGETNHWVIAWLGDTALSFGPFGSAEFNSKLIKEVIHIYGQNCASILLARWMATGKLNKPSVEP